MKAYILDIFAKIQRHSAKLEEQTLLLHHHWVLIQELSNSKCVYIFRENNDLIISQNGQVTRARWEQLGNNSLLIETSTESSLYRLGFFSEFVLALKLDSSEEFIPFINESKIGQEINSINDLSEYLTKKYLTSALHTNEEAQVQKYKDETYWGYSTDKGYLEILQLPRAEPGIAIGRKVFLNGKPAPDGKYKVGLFSSITVKNGRIDETGLF